MIKPISTNPLTGLVNETVKVNKSIEGEMNVFLGRKDINTGSPLMKGNEYQNNYGLPPKSYVA